ncbi:MAG: hypothetical protein ACO2ZM_05305 [Francisellaceae bacterium]
MKQSRLIKLSTLLISSIILAACGGGSSGDDNEVTTGDLSISIDSNLPTEVVSGQTAEFSSTISYNQALKFGYAKTNQALNADDITISNVSVPAAENVNSRFDSNQPEPGGTCWNGTSGASLSVGQSCTLHYYVSSDQPDVSLSGDIIVSTTGAVSKTQRAAIEVEFKADGQLSNGIDSLGDTPTFAPDATVSFRIDNHNDKPIYGLALDLSNLPDEILAMIDADSFSGGSWDSESKQLKSDQILSIGLAHTFSFRLSAEAEAVLYDYLDKLRINRDSQNKPLITLKGVNINSFSPSGFDVDMIPAAFTATTMVDAIGGFEQYLTNHGDEAITIESITADSALADYGYTLENTGSCVRGGVIEPGQSCSIAYTANANALSMENPVTLSYKDAKANAFSTDRQPSKLVPAAVTLSLLNPELLVQETAENGTPVLTNIGIINDDPSGFTARFERLTSAFMSLDSSDGGADPLDNGLFTSLPESSVPACANHTLAKGAVCYVGIISNKTPTASAASYVMKISAHNNINALSDNFSLQKGSKALTAGVDTVAISPTVKKIKIENAGDKDGAIRLDIDKTQIPGIYDIYDQGADQSWCTTAGCPDSCFSKTNPIPDSGTAYSLMLSKADNETAGVCYIYVKGSGFGTLGSPVTAELSVMGLGNGSLSKRFHIDNETYLYAGGSFTDADGHQYVARFDGFSWQDIGDGPENTPFNNIILNLVADDEGRIYAAGSFKEDEGERFIARYDDGVWSELEGFRANGDIYALSLDHKGQLYAGGDFINVKGHRYVAHFNGNDWQDLGDNFNKYIWTIDFDTDDNLYAAGYFDRSDAYDSPDSDPFIAMHTNGSWGHVPGSDFNRAFRDTLSIGDKLYVVGDFRNEAGNTYLAEYDQSDNLWKDLGSGPSQAPFLSRQVYFVVSDQEGENLYMGGEFQNAEGDAYVARYNIDSASWSNIGSGPNHLFSNNFIRDAVMDDEDNLFVSGKDGVVAKYNSKTDTWSDLSMPANPGDNTGGYIHSLALGRVSTITE